MDLPNGSAITFEHFSQRHENLFSYINVYMNAHSSFIVVTQNGKLHKCPSVDEWLNKLWYIYTRALPFSDKYKLSVYTTFGWT